MQNLVIEEIKKINDDMEELSELLKTVVNDGASIGFLPSLDQKESAKYWGNCFSTRSDLICC